MASCVTESSLALEWLLAIYPHYTHWGKIGRSNLHKVARLHTHILGYSRIGHFISNKCASIFVQNAPNTSAYLSIRPESFRTDLRGSEVATGQRKFLSLNGRKSTERKHMSGRLLHEARVLAWGKEKTYYYAHKL